ncbi:MAG: RnfABCDGE type electron transport complex subunit G [Candidatus Omnitrophota bacterium]
MNQMFKFGMILGVICLLATLVLAATYQVTKPKIEAQMRLEEQAALKAILPAADSFKEKTLDGIEYFEAFKGGSLSGYCLKITASGYGGYIRLIAGITPDGVIKGVRILEHQETPGLGSQIDQVKPGEKDPWFLRQFVGKSARTVAVKKDIDAITGATISSEAVTGAIRTGADVFLLKVKR